MDREDSEAEAASAIHNLISAYCHAIDRGDFDAVGKLFEHGDFCHAMGDNPPAIRLRSSAVADYMRGRIRLYEDGTPRTRHLVTNTTLDIDEVAGAATARSYLTTMQQAPNHGIETIAVALYEDHLKRVDGTWRFAERIVRAPSSDGVNRDFVGDMSRHTRVR